MRKEKKANRGTIPIKPKFVKASTIGEKPKAEVN
jgi:hypothetical protein